MDMKNSGGLCCLHDLAEEVDVSFEGFAADCGEFVGGAWTRAGFVTILTDVISGNERAHVGDEIAIAHAELGFEILKSPFRAGGEQCHDGKPTLLMNELVELVEVDHSATTSAIGRVRMNTATA